MPDRTSGLCVMPHRDGRPRRAHAPLLLCTGHHLALSETLTGRVGTQPSMSLAELYDALADTLAGRTAGGTDAPVTGSHTDRLPINDHTADIRVAIRRTLASWARLHVDDLSRPAPRCKACTTAREACAEHRATGPSNEEPATTIAYLARHLDWAAAQPWIDDYLGELTDLRGRAWNAYDLTRIRSIWQLGRCPLRAETGRCPGTVQVVIREQRDETLTTTVSCTADRTHQWEPEQWRRLGKRLRAA